MKILKPDPTRRITIEGIVEPVRRPVDIDASKTRFRDLKTLRIYCFDPGSVVDGHAEEDEVFIVVLAGTVEITLRGEGREVGPVTLGSEALSCAAYLPPNGEYRLVAKGEAEVAYARATPSRARAPRIFEGSDSTPVGGSPAAVHLQVMEYAEKLQLRILRLDTEHDHFRLDEEAETLVHVNGSVLAQGEGQQASLDAWDTVVVERGEVCTLRLASASPAMALIVSAR